MELQHDIDMREDGDLNSMREDEGLNSRDLIKDSNDDIKIRSTPDSILSGVLNKLDKDWRDLFEKEKKKSYFIKLDQQLMAEYKKQIVCPKRKDLFNAFLLTPFSSIKVVILGQDPYHGKDQAHGLSFSCNGKIPPSLHNIFTTISIDLGGKMRSEANLMDWAKQGVFLLNSCLSVLLGKPASHEKLGWQKFTDMVIKRISTEKEHVVFLLWGAFALKKQRLIDDQKHLILKTVHPSPYSAKNGFFDCKHFSKTNDYLKAHELEPIKWCA